MRKTLLLMIGCILICASAYRWGDVKFTNAKMTAMEQMYIEVSRLFFPQLHLYRDSNSTLLYRDVEQVMLPVVSGYRVSLGYVDMGQEESVLEGTAQSESNEIVQNHIWKPIDIGDSIGDSIAEHEQTEIEPTVGREKQVIINRVKLQDFDYLRQTFYQIDNTTTIDAKTLNADKFLGKDMTLKQGIEGPQILIYHTHSQEAYADSTEGDPYTSVVALGDYLGRILSEEYGIEVLHHMGKYDVMDRDSAYSTALPYLEAVLEEYPSIEVIIDLHRDGVPDTTHLVTEVNGKPTAQIMFFNGLSKTTAQGNLEYLANPYIEENLAFSFQMQLAAAEYYPGFARRIYLKGYRYNMHLLPKSLLIEVGAQTNTYEEAKNAMEPLADILVKVLKGM